MATSSQAEKSEVVTASQSQKAELLVVKEGQPEEPNNSNETVIETEEKLPSITTGSK